MAKPTGPNEVAEGKRGNAKELEGEEEANSEDVEEEEGASDDEAEEGEADEGNEEVKGGVDFGHEEAEDYEDELQGSAPHPNCAAKHTAYNPMPNEWRCPWCNRDNDFCIDEPAPGAHEDCAALHEQDGIYCGHCEDGLSGKTLSKKYMEKQNLVPCPTCHGQGTVDGRKASKSEKKAKAKKKAPQPRRLKATPPAKKKKTKKAAKSAPKKKQQKKKKRR